MEIDEDHVARYRSKILADYLYANPGVAEDFLQAAAAAYRSLQGRSTDHADYILADKKDPKIDHDNNQGHYTQNTVR